MKINALVVSAGLALAFCSAVHCTDVSFKNAVLPEIDTALIPAQGNGPLGGQKSLNSFGAIELTFETVRSRVARGNDLAKRGNPAELDRLMPDPIPSSW